MDRPPLWKLTPEEKREVEYDEYVARKENYNAAIEAAGDEPWWKGTNPEERRARWQRKYSRPDPPVGLFNDLADIREDTTEAVR